MEWAHNGLFYVFGLALYAHRQVLLAHYVRRWPWYGVAGLLCFLASGGVLEQVPADARQTLPMGVRWAFSWAYNAAAWCWSFALIGLFTAHLGRHSPAMRYLADSSYWVYLVHMPMTIGFGAVLFGLPWPAGVKMLVNIAATTALSLASYHWLVRSTAVGLLLNGKRHGRPRARAALPTAAPWAGCGSAPAATDCRCIAAGDARGAEQRVRPGVDMSPLCAQRRQKGRQWCPLPVAAGMPLRSAPPFSPTDPLLTGSLSPCNSPSV
jgi:hypothetical protein